MISIDYKYTIDRINIYKKRKSIKTTNKPLYINLYNCMYM